MVTMKIAHSRFHEALYLVPDFLFKNNFLKKLSLQNNALRKHDNGK